MKKETNSQPKQVPVEGSSEALKQRSTVYVGKRVFKKVECLSSRQGKITTKDKVKVICELRHKYSVKALVTYADIPRSTFYDMAVRPPFN